MHFNTHQANSPKKKIVKTIENLQSPIQKANSRLKHCIIHKKKKNTEKEVRPFAQQFIPLKLIYLTFYLNKDKCIV